MRHPWLVLGIATALGAATAVLVGVEVSAQNADLAGGSGPVQGIPIDPARELMIRDLSVVEDPLRTTWPRPGPTPAITTAKPIRSDAAAWTFGRLVQNMAGKNDPADFVMRWLRHWEADQVVNGFVVPARPSIRALVIDPWLRRSGGRALDLAKAPFRLLAIVNRLDLRQNPVYGPGNAGEGRFVFGVLDETGSPLPFTVIFEYELPAANLDDVKAWARAWHDLGSIPFGASLSFALNRVTDRFAGPGAAPRKPNGSALNQIRTNEIALAGPWELREFTISAATGFLEQATVKQTPDLSFNGTRALADFVNANEAVILAGRHRIPARWLGGGSPAPTLWNAPRIRNSDARHQVGLATCSGCHTVETGTGFLHIGTRFPGQAASLSGFLTGTVVLDPVTGAPRAFDDLGRRAKDLAGVLGATRAQLMTEVASTREH